LLAHLLANVFRGRVKLINIDPPFDSGAGYVRKVQLRGSKGTPKIDGEDCALGEQIQYTDISSNDNYLQFMYERLLMLKECQRAARVSEVWESDKLPVTLEEALSLAIPQRLQSDAGRLARAQARPHRRALRTPGAADAASEPARSRSRTICKCIFSA